MSFSRCVLLVSVPFNKKTSMEKQSEASWRPTKESSCASCHLCREWSGRVLERVSSNVTGRGESSLVRQLPLAAVLGAMKAQLAPRPSPELAVCLALGGGPEPLPSLPSEVDEMGTTGLPVGPGAWCPSQPETNPLLFSACVEDTNTGACQGDRTATQLLASPALACQCILGPPRPRRADARCTPTARSTEEHSTNAKHLPADDTRAQVQVPTLSVEARRRRWSPMPFECREAYLEVWSGSCQVGLGGCARACARVFFWRILASDW